MAASPLYKNATFNSLGELKQACKAHAIDKLFEYKVIYSDKRCYTIECKVAECPWRLHSSSIGGSSQDLKRPIPVFDSITSQADKTFIAKHIAEKLKEQLTYRPVDIVKDVQRELAVKIRRLSMQKNTPMNSTTARTRLPIQVLRRHHRPNSVALLEKAPGDKIKRIFICYGACSAGFIYCCPLLGLDGTHLKTKYQGPSSYSSV